MHTLTKFNSLIRNIVFTYLTPSKFSQNSQKLISLKKDRKRNVFQSIYHRIKNLFRNLRPNPEKQRPLIIPEEPLRILPKQG